MVKQDGESWLWNKGLQHGGNIKGFSSAYGYQYFGLFQFCSVKRLSDVIPKPLPIGHNDSGLKLQIITGCWEMSSVTKRRWMVIPRKPSGLGDTPHERCTCNRTFLYKGKNRHFPTGSSFKKNNCNGSPCIFLSYQDGMNCVMGNSLYTTAPVLNRWYKSIILPEILY